VSSDAFAFGEEAQIYASVTYNGYRVQGLLVAFEISGPKNPVENITIFRVGTTNETGVAKTSFRISYFNQTTSGEWSVTGSTVFADIRLQDSMTFKVGWIVEIVSVRTVDQWYLTQGQFMRGTNPGIEIGLRNIAMTSKIATIAATIYDNLNTRVDSTQIVDFAVQPNATLVYVYLSLYIPETTIVGNATVYACAYTAPVESNGAAYCPEVSRQFSITARRYFLQVNTDAVGFASISGGGWYEEHTNATIAASQIASVSSGVQYKFNHWDADGALESVRSSVTTILMEANHTAVAHYLLQYYLTIKVDPPEVATVSGEGWYNRSQVVTLSAPSATNYYFDHWDVDGVSKINVSTSATVVMDNPHVATAHYAQTKYTLSIEVTKGGTTNPAPGSHTYVAGSTVQVTAVANPNYLFNHWELDGVDVGSTDLYNVLIDKDHTLKAVFSVAPYGLFVPSWFYWFLLLLFLVILLIILLLWLYRRRKKSQESFYSGWTAWFYSYDLRSEASQKSEHDIHGKKS
jgi:hypothetical protein